MTGKIFGILQLEISGRSYKNNFIDKCKQPYNRQVVIKYSLFKQSRVQKVRLEKLAGQ